MKKISVSLVRLLVGVVFIISGFVKLVDPIGFSFKLEEYFEPHVLDMPFFIPYAYPIAILWWHLNLFWECCCFWGI